MFKNIVIATDGSKHSENAAAKGLEIAKLTQGKVTVLSIADSGRYILPVDVSYNIADDVIGSVKRSVREEGEIAVRRVEVMAKEAGVPAESKIVEGNPADDIIKTAEEGRADLIVMGGMGKTGLEKFLLGSVAEKVVRNSKIPVLVVR
jgi:nucleotide-binding universal stress UspA family protein